MDEREIDRRLEEILGPPLSPPPAAVNGRILESVLASRTHVRVLRVLVGLGNGRNLTARELARRAEASHGRVLEVLGQLTAAAVVTAQKTPTHGIYRLAEAHPLADVVRSLFDHERLTTVS
jgi:DNA-binding transcriptional ArsR family regulator